MSYKSTHTGAQIDAGVSAALNPDATPTLSSTNLVTSGGVAAKLSEKQDTLVFDNAPTSGSNNPVKSGGIYTADAALKQMILSSFPTDSISNQSIASFADGADGIPVKALTVNITPVQEGSGDPSPVNQRPISGWTGAKVSDTAKNLFDASTAESGYVTSTGEINSDDTGRHSPLIPVTSGETYTFSGYANGYTASRRFHAYDANGNWMEQIAAITDSTLNQWYALTAAITSGARYVRLSWRREDTSIMLEKGSARTTYEAFGTVYPVSWQSEAGTVYGGTLTDNGDGTWTLVKTMVGVDMGTMTWGASSQSGCFYTNSINDYKNVNNMVFYCSEYKPDGHGSTGDVYGTDNTIRYFLSESSGRAFNVHDNAQAGKTGEQFASAVSGVILVYELATPAAPITLTADSVKTLLGANNIFADCGDVASLTYRADVGLYIDKKLAEA